MNLTKNLFYQIDFYIFILFLFFIIFFKYLKIFDKIKRYVKLRKIPGPRGLPLVGRGFDLRFSSLVELLEEWSKQYGPIYKVRIFAEDILVLSNYEVVYEALVDKANAFSGRPPNFYRAKLLCDNSFDIVSSSPSTPWFCLRKIIHREIKHFDHDMDKLDKSTNSVMHDLVEELRSYGDRPLNPKELILSSVINLNCLFLIGRKIFLSDERLLTIKHLIRKVTELMSVGGIKALIDYFPWLRFLGNKTYKEIMKVREMRDEICDWMMKTCSEDFSSQESFTKGVVHDLLELLVSEQPEITDINIKLTILNILIGGTSTTYGYFYVIIHLLAENPSVQERVWDEVKVVLGNAKRSSLKYKKIMPYTRAVLLEVLRFASLSPVLIPHYTLQESEVAGVQVPRDVTVYILTRAIHHDPQIWKNPLSFDPLRFLKRDQTQVTLPNHHHIRGFFFFGAGTRSCPGETLAMNRLFLFLTHLVQKFKIKRGKGFRKLDPRLPSVGLVSDPADEEFCFEERN